MPLRSQIRRVPGVGAVRAWQQGRLKESDYHNAILTLSEGNSLIRRALIAGRPCLIGRVGQTELTCVTHYLRARRTGASKGYPRPVILTMGNNAGFFRATNETLDGFVEEYLAAVHQLDAVGVWFNRGENDLVREFCPTADLIPLVSLEPYYHEEPWSIGLAGKRVLVVHPFADSIAENYAQRRSLLFEDPRVLPDFELHVLKAVQSIAGEQTEHASWFDALSYMKSEMEAVDFDVCIIGAGSYGLPLAAHAKKLGKMAVHLGGATQILFGIRGRRWDDHKIISKLYNEHWTRPKPWETPDRANRVEGGAYW
jgi:hypothetical protein